MSATNYPFAACGNGHALDGEGSFIYLSNGNRECRMCAAAKQPAKKRAVMQTWSEKRGEHRQVFKGKSQ